MIREKESYMVIFPAPKETEQESCRLLFTDYRGPFAVLVSEPHL